jgi:A/G-specific adenine glycosylase
MRAFRAALVGWFRREGRDYPWRRTRDPYAVLVSEVMLQQTQIATVLGRGYYARWMEQFPTPAVLAAADESTVLRAWEGLGYYRRARNLQLAARAVMEKHGGTFPGSLEEIAALPGVGRYTAGAVQSFARDQPAPIVDGNIARVLARLFSLELEIDAPAGQRTLWAWAGALMDRRHPRLYNSALMELGQRLCTPRRPGCDQCPVRVHCQSAGPGAERLPLKKPARATVAVAEHALWCLRRARLLMVQETGPRRRGLWRLPLRPADECAALPVLSCTQYAITHHRVTLTIHHAPDARPADGEEWQPLTALPGLALPGPLRRAVTALLP